ncbi:MAG: hypothetical protein LH702_33015 [Phormidesmis sp. CAN_BIN44]|nr:hypothetical protein [Phormidesmis sp. CAN_BIN44]
MDENLTKDSDVARDRLTLDITDLKERIEECRSDDPAWRELSLSGKIRALLVQQLEELEQHKKSPATESKGT